MDFKKIGDMTNKYSALTEFKGFKPKTVLNLTFRGGNYSLKLKRWTAEEEAEILPILVKTGQKPVGSIVLQNLKNGIDDVIVPPNCKTFLYTNQWNVEILLVYNPNNTNYKMILEKYKNDTEKMLTELCDEKMYERDIGILYGYDDDFN
jgi:PleD family two-component response regulator